MGKHEEVSGHNESKSTKTSKWKSRASGLSAFLFGTGGLVAVLAVYVTAATSAHWFPFESHSPNNPPATSTPRPITSSPRHTISPSSQTTISSGMVKRQLLIPDDLSSLGSLSFKGVDEAIVTSNSCAHWTVKPIIQKARQLTSTDTPPTVVAFESISVFSTTGDAHAAFKADQNQLMCFSGLPHVSSEDISSKVHTCDYTAAAHATFTGRRGLFDAYTGEIICGRALTVLEFDSLDSSPYSTIGEFSTLISIAIQKVQALPDLGS